MKITNISLYRISPYKQEGICACAAVEIDNLMVIRNIKVIKGKEKFFVSFPNDGRYSVRDGVKRYTDIVYLNSPELRQQFEDEIVQKYKDVVKENSHIHDR